jgi:hypothetical protein
VAKINENNYDRIARFVFADNAASGTGLMILYAALLVVAMESFFNWIL